MCIHGQYETLRGIFDKNFSFKKFWKKNILSNIDRKYIENISVLSVVKILNRNSERDGNMPTVTTFL